MVGTDCSQEAYVLPEGDETRSIQAALVIRVVAEVVNVAFNYQRPDSIRDQYIEPMVELRKVSLMHYKLCSTAIFGTMMLALDHYGLVLSSQEAFQLIKLHQLLTGFIIFSLPDEFIRDCAINPDPNAEHLQRSSIG